MLQVSFRQLMRRQIETPARTALKAWAQKDKRRTRTSIGRSCGVSQPAVGAWFDGTSRPEPHLRMVLETLTGGVVREVDWELLEEAQQRADALERIQRGSPTGTEG
jgi:hypothetical protein